MVQTLPRSSAARSIGAIDWVVPAAAVLGIGLAAIAAMRAGGEAPQIAPRLTQATILPVAAFAEPGAPRAMQAIGTATGAIERCDGVSGLCRTLPVEDILYRMSDGSEWVARTAYDDRGQVAYTLWYDGTGMMVGTPLGL